MQILVLSSNELQLICEEATFVQSAVLKRPKVRQQVELFTRYSLMHIWNAQIWLERFKSTDTTQSAHKKWSHSDKKKNIQKGQSEALKSKIKICAVK